MKKLIFLLLICCISAFLFRPDFDIPPVWSSKHLDDLYLPLADSSVQITHLPGSLYYRLPEKVMYKTYPMYLPGDEPEGYYDELLRQEPEIVFDVSQLQSEADWIAAGELVYEYPEDFFAFSPSDTAFLRGVRASTLAYHEPLTADKRIPTASIVIRKKGQLEFGSFGCNLCHTRVMPDGSIFKGGQGNVPFDLAFGTDVAGLLLNPDVPDSVKQTDRKEGMSSLFAAPWIKGGLQQKLYEISNEELVKSLTNTYGGVMHRHGTVIGAPTSIPDLYNMQDRKYLDHTGLIQQRGIEDLMLYATLNQRADRYDKYNHSFSMVPWPNEGGSTFERYSDEQLYALAKFIYALEAPKNPDKAPADLLERGEQIFREQSCVTCHTPPLFTNNQLTPVDGFEVPESHFEQYDIFNVSVETDPSLALESRRGTGYYKIPSLIGVWNRTALLHSGNVKSLEELLDPARLEDDYVPQGYMPGWLEVYPVKGHPFGLELAPEDKAALIAYLKSL